MTGVFLGSPQVRVDRSGVSNEAAAELAQRLARTVGGDVRFGEKDRALYATDGSNYRQVPIGVVLPRDPADVEATLAACREIGAPVLGRGAGTSLAGQCCNVAVVLDFSRYMNRILEVDVERRQARVQPGVLLDRLRARTEPMGITFGPDPATHAWCTIGGMIGNNSCGTHSLVAGKTVDNVEALSVLLYDGTRFDTDAQPTTSRAEAIRAGLRALGDRYADEIREGFPDLPRRVSGFNLDELLPERGFHLGRALVGSESTCALTVEATLRLVPWPEHRRLVVLGYPDFFLAADAVPHVLEHAPIGLEGLDDRLVADMRSIGLNVDKLPLLPDGGGWLLAEFGADTASEVDAQVEGLLRVVGRGAGRPSVARYDDPAQQRAVWSVRESGLGATAHPRGRLPNWEGWEDSAVAPDRIGDYLRDLTRLWAEFGYTGALYGHVGQGCVHTRNDFDLRSKQGIATFRRYIEAAADLCVAYGGSLSGEHGDGQARGELLGKMFGPRLVDAFREFRAIWDPDGRMNPGKVIDAFPLDSNLRYGPGYRPLEVGRTHFRFAQDQGSFAGAVERCEGVGRCRRDEGWMCPSYIVTGEEEHSTRGRARLLFEMLRGEVVRGGWRSRAVRESLDLCISCKGCKVECPVSVDMAAYKAEFLSHHYRWRLRPLSSYALGLFHWEARAAVRVPRLVNAAARAPILSRLGRRLAGITTRRPVPEFASETFRRWFGRRSEPSCRPQVLLWPDTFTDTLSPHVGKAAVAVLEDAGFAVRLPSRVLCCGRPLYDTGMLPSARRLLVRTLATLADDLAAGTPIVVLEPSCLAVFRDELLQLFPDDERALRLSRQAVTLAEFLQEVNYQPPRAPAGAAVLHGHCHQKATGGMDADLAVLRRAGLDTELLASGCCGLAGSFGFTAKHYEASMAIGESALLPAVRRATLGTVVVADGFSCATQITHGTGRRPQHRAEVLAGRLPVND